MAKALVDYLNQNPDEKKVLVIGCGSTPERAMIDANIEGIACSLGTTHTEDFTIDISPEAGADLTMDLVTYRGTELGIYGRNRFDAVVFEYVSRGPRHLFSPAYIRLWIDAADDLLKIQGRIIFYSFLSDYLEPARERMEELGYRVTMKIVNPNENSPHGHKCYEGIKLRTSTGTKGYFPDISFQRAPVG